MNTKRATKRALLTSVMALVMCVVMLVGTTFAWFTDTASTDVNKIQAGKLDVALYYDDGTGENGAANWVSAEGEAALGWVQATQANGKTIVATDGLPLWEPGCTFTLPQLKIVNEGDLALKYKIVVSGIQGNAKLLKAIDFTMELDGQTEELGTEHNLTANSANIFTISGTMKKEAGNEYQGLSIDGIAITVYATQLSSEFDSYNNTYDANALYDLKINESATGNLPVNVATDDGKAVTVAENTTIKSGLVSVTYPESTKLTTTESDVSTSTDGSEQKASVGQELKYTGEKLSEKASQTISISADTQAVASYELNLPVAEDNTKLVTVEIDYQKNLTGVVIYHSGVKLTQNAADNKDGEYFTYDSKTGKLVLYLKHASPIDVVFDKPGTRTVTDRAELEAALDDATVTTIKLGADIACPEDNTSAIQVLRDVTIDFNGHVLGIGLESGTTSYKGPSTNLVLTDSTNAERSGDVSAIKIFEDGGFRQFAAVCAWQSKVTINGGLYEHNNGVVWSQLQPNNQQETFVINGGTFVGKGGASSIYSGGGTVTINGGTFSAEYSADDECGDCIYVSYVSKNVASITNITNGTFTSANRLIYVNVKDGYTQKVNISGGTFTVGSNSELVVFSTEVTNVKDYITITGGTFNVDPSAYVADGYKAVDNSDGTWTVKAAT